MAHRINWEFTSTKSVNYNFRWKYYPGRVNYREYQYSSSLPNSKLKMINVFQNYSEIGDKQKFFINLLKYCDDNSLNIFSYIPFTCILSKDSHYKTNISSINTLMKILSSFKKPKDNFIPISYHSLFKLPLKYTFKDTTYNHSIFPFFPKTFTSTTNYWIIKPNDLCQGMGIKLAKTIDDVISYSKEIFEGIDKVTAEAERYCKEHNKELIPKTYKAISMVIQKYLDMPLLYYNRKFDIRCFVLIDHCMNVYFCKEGHLKACSNEYNMKTTDKFSHLTNYSLQKKCENFSKYEQSNEISYAQFKEALKYQGYNNVDDIFNYVIFQMKQLVKLSLSAVGKKIAPIPKVLSFQIFGYDFIIDKELKVYIIEINDNPGLEISSELIGKLVPRMIDDAFRLTIDKMFHTVYSEDVLEKDPITQEIKYKSKFSLPGYSDNENIFEFLCNINHYPTKIEI